jgi:putative FmdB family regulatory protein
MPIYEYVCENCQHAFETIQKISDDPLRKCPECGRLKLKKRMSRAAFRLKGGGWYETDFKSGGKKNVAGDDKAPTKDTTGTGEGGKSDGAKPALDSAAATTKGTDKSASTKSPGSAASD